MPRPDVSIMIVYYSGDLIFETIQAVYDANVDLSFEIIVTDNNAKLGLQAKLQEQFPEVIYQDNQANLGFAKGMNAAYKLAKGRHVLVYNPDVILKQGALEALVKFLESHDDVGIVSPKLEYTDGSTQASACRVPRWITPIITRTPLRRTAFGKAEMRRYLMEDMDHSVTQDVDSTTGAAMLVRRKAWEQVNGFDGRYKLYYEDNDFCRMMWQNNWRVVYHPASVMTHYHRRETADGSLLDQIKRRTTWIQVESFLKYKIKYFFAGNPRKTYMAKHGTIQDN